MSMLFHTHVFIEQREDEVDPQPLILNQQPSTLNLQHSTLNPQPSTLNPQPSTLKLFVLYEF